MSRKNKTASVLSVEETAYVPVDDDFQLDTSLDITVDRNYASQGFWKGVFTRFFKNKRAVFGLVIIFIIIVFAIFGPGMNGYGYSDIVSIKDAETGKEITARSTPPLAHLPPNNEGGEALARRGQQILAFVDKGV